MMDAIWHHIAISVRDMDRATRFYCDQFGFLVDWDMDHRSGEALSKVVGMPGVDVHMVMLKGFGMRIELFHYYQPMGVEPSSTRQCDFGLTHFALQVRRIHNIYERLVAAGVRFNSPPMNLRPGVWATYMQDPENNTVELIQYDD